MLCSNNMVKTLSEDTTILRRFKQLSKQVACKWSKVLQNVCCRALEPANILPQKLQLSKIRKYLH